MRPMVTIQFPLKCYLLPRRSYSELLLLQIPGFLYCSVTLVRRLSQILVNKSVLFYQGLLNAVDLN